MITSRNGIVIRLPIHDVSVLGRNTQGVRLINLEAGDTVGDVARIIQDDEEETAAVVGTAPASATAGDGAGDFGADESDGLAEDDDEDEVDAGLDEDDEDAEEAEDDDEENE